ncbi:hypothetical protein K1719_020643 [Acacia pycnantha]|nr:hypothetical protein K1719_020643 [Acacia pycnantha]
MLSKSPLAIPHSVLRSWRKILRGETNVICYLNEQRHLSALLHQLKTARENSGAWFISGTGLGQLEAKGTELPTLPDSTESTENFARNWVVNSGEEALSE